MSGFLKRYFLLFTFVGGAVLINILLLCFGFVSGDPELAKYPILINAAMSLSVSFIAHGAVGFAACAKL